MVEETKNMETHEKEPEELYDVIFEGNILAGQSEPEVKQRLSQLYKTDFEGLT